MAHRSKTFCVGQSVTYSVSVMDNIPFYPMGKMGTTTRYYKDIIGLLCECDGCIFTLEHHMLILYIFFQIQLTMLCTGLKSCKLVIWTANDHLELDIPFDQNYAEKEIHHLRQFYFNHMLPALVDEYMAKKFKLCENYLKLAQTHKEM